MLVRLKNSEIRFNLMSTQSLNWITEFLFLSEHLSTWRKSLIIISLLLVAALMTIVLLVLRGLRLQFESFLINFLIGFQEFKMSLIQKRTRAILRSSKGPSCNDLTISLMLSLVNLQTNQILRKLSNCWSVKSKTFTI
jgi:hypothetical protein